MRVRRGRAAAAARLAANRKPLSIFNYFVSRAMRDERSCESDQLSKRVKPGPWAALGHRDRAKIKAPSVSIYTSSP